MRPSAVMNKRSGACMKHESARHHLIQEYNIYRDQLTCVYSKRLNWNQLNFRPYQAPGFLLIKTNVWTDIQFMHDR